MNIIVKHEGDVDTVAKALIVRLNDDKDTLVTISDVKNSRTLAQNSLMWFWYARMRDHVKDVTGRIYKTEAYHEEMKEMFLEPIVLELRNKVRKKYSTKKLTPKQFKEYLENIDMYCADALSLVLPHPDDMFNEAMGRK
jgi:hypothetical protein